MKISGIKKILFLAITLSLFFVHHSFAAYTLSVPTPTSTTVTATLNGAAGSTSSFKLIIQTATLPTTPPTVNVIPGDLSVQKPNAQGVVTWSIANNTPGTKYNIGVEEIPAATTVLPTYAVASTTATIPQQTFYYNHLTTTTSGNNVILQGSLDVTKQPNYQSFKVYLAYSASADMSNPIQTNEQSLQAPIAGAPVGITDGLDGLGDPAGSYYWVLGGLNPNTTYYARQTIVLNGQSVVDAIVAFNGGTGVITSTANNTTGGASSNLNTNTYTLLSPLPGLSVLPDPQICAQQQAAAAAAGTNPPLCSVNDLLNYALKLLIGVSGIVLVLRLMYEGYKYMTTDVPFLKASAKSGFFTALLGLMLALSSYVILNTINPKLVSESVNVSQLSIGVDQTSIDSGTFQTLTGETLQTESQYSAMADTISQQQGIDSCIVKATIQVESDWNAAAIGCDENSPYSNVPSRMAYLASGINFDGSTFTPTNNAGASQRNNGCSFDPSKAPGYGLDWRFSKGGGLMQFTVAPQGYKSAAWYAGVKSGGSYYISRNTPYPGWQNIIKPEANIAKGIGILKEGLAACGSSNIAGVFAYYQQGNGCTSNSSLVSATVAKKMSVYNSCKGQ